MRASATSPAWRPPAERSTCRPGRPEHDHRDGQEPQAHDAVEPVVVAGHDHDQEDRDGVRRGEPTPARTQAQDHRDRDQRCPRDVHRRHGGQLIGEPGARLAGVRALAELGAGVDHPEAPARGAAATRGRRCGRPARAPSSGSARCGTSGRRLGVGRTGQRQGAEHRREVHVLVDPVDDPDRGVGAGTQSCRRASLGSRSVRSSDQTSSACARATCSEPSKRCRQSR